VTSSPPTALLAALLILPFLALPGIAAAASASRQAVAVAAGATMLGGLGLLLLLAPPVFAGETLVATLPWLSEWGLDLSLRLDGLGLLFVLLINGIGLLIVIYAYYYMPNYDRLGRLYVTLLAFAGGMLGVVLAENVLLMLLFWEITSLTSFLLIAYKYREREARIAARMALAVTGGGGLALLAGLILLGQVAGSYELTAILARGDLIRDHALYPVVLVLVLLGAFTKSAQFPFHFWLPNAMAAPTPVSAYLHSATMVKAGVFLLARLYPALSGTDLWFGLVTTTGAATFLIGAYLALLKHDFKGLLAYSTISHLGLITMLLGLSTPLSPVAAVFHIINHAVFKASLFMAAGIIDHECGTRDMRRINGLMKYMPITATLGIVAAGAMAGVPFLNGFLSKEMFFAETVAHPALTGLSAILLPGIATLGGILSAAYSARFVHDVFFNGEPIDLPRTPHEPVRWMRLPVEVLVGLVVAVGLLPQLVVAPLLAVASQAVLQQQLPPFKLAIWHGFNLPLIMSIVALGGGILWYIRRDQLFRLHERLPFQWSSPVAFERAYAGATRFSRRTLSFLDRGTLRQSVALYLGFTLVLGVWAWARYPTALAGPLGRTPADLVGPLGRTPADLVGLAGLAVLVVGLAGTVILHRQRLTAIIFLSVVGLVVSLAFIRLAAPDLALTQLTVEVASIMLLLLALRFLPAEAAADERPRRLLRDGLLAGGAGLGVSALCFAMLTRPFETISAYHIANSKPLGGGTNVVNVTLVDYRGFDTLGEIAVLAMAALGIQALLSGLALKSQAGSAQTEADRYPIMLRMLMRPLLPLAIAVAVYIFLRGHNLPGGGFIAGLVAAIAILLQYVSAGAGFAAPKLRLPFAVLLASGLLIATATGAGSWLFGQPFLTTSYTYVTLPIVGTFELATAMLFDFGIFLVVLGTLLIALTELGQLSAREQREPDSG
jgi:multicomponent K+:H+ antiporter subunit A